jgi:hypothetical protein
MQITFIVPVVLSAVFGLVVAGVYYLIAGPWPSIRLWLAGAWVLACLCYIILFGVISL